LSQLYQVRGRVGRGDRQGFCYLVVPKGVTLSNESIDRLKTIQENTDLGSGYRIALKDLEIRGAGNVFGYEQSGHISKIGYNLYCQMFNEELNSSRGKLGAPSIPKITYFGDASLKEGYMPLSQDRLFYYQRLSNVKVKKDLSNVKKEIKDRFGKPGVCVRNLYKITALRLAYTNTMINKIFVEKDRAILFLKKEPQKTTNELDIERLMKALESAKIKYVFKQKNKVSFGLELICDTSEEPLIMLIQHAELFYYNNNNS
jgi:transcription-repair coupling factor (superfamily II helicase)